jgi:hypothetical protein
MNEKSTVITTADTIQDHITEARERLHAADNKRDIALYVGEGEEPVKALLKIRQYLTDHFMGGFVGAEAQQSRAMGLPVACLDRVIAQLKAYRLRYIYEAIEGRGK